MSTTDEELSAQAVEMAKHWHRAGIAEQDICEAMVATGIAGSIALRGHQKTAAWLSALADVVASAGQPGRH